MGMEAGVTADGPSAMADQDVCIAIGETLTQAYPRYIWNVGCTHLSHIGSVVGVAYISLVIPSVAQNTMEGYMLRLSTVLGPGGYERVKQAGGELLERWGLPREGAPRDFIQRANENGLDRSHMVLKSRY